MQGDFDRSWAVHLEGIEVAQECGDMRTVALAENNLGNIALRLGDPRAARLHFESALELHRELSAVADEGGALCGIAAVALFEEAVNEAASLYGQSLRLALTVGSHEDFLSGLLGAADIAARRGEPVRAARLLGAADSLREQTGYVPHALELDQGERVRSGLDGDDAAVVVAESEGRALSVNDAVAYALAGLD